MTIVEFLLARIDEDEAIANAAHQADYHENQTPRWDETSSGVVATGDDLIATGDSGLSRHIARHDPTRVLAECEAKRRIAELHDQVMVIICGYGSDEPMTESDVAVCRSCGTRYEYPVEAPCPTLRALAAVYANHPDYDQAWKL